MFAGSSIRPLSARAACTRLLVSGVLLGFGCSDPKDPWWDALEPSGFCHQVNLLDGLDPSEGRELTNTFYCLNQQGSLAPLVSSVAALQQPARDQETGAVHLSQGINRLLEADLNAFELAGTLLDWLEADAPLLQESLKIVVELIYATPYSLLEDADAPPDQVHLDNGALAPLLGGLREGLIAALDDDLSPLRTFDAALHSPKTTEVLHTLSALTQSPEITYRNRMDDLLSDFGAALLASRSPENNRSSSGTEESLRDLISALVLNRDEASRSAVDLADEAIGTVFADTKARDRVLNALHVLEKRDALRTLPLQLRYFGDVPADGGSFGPGVDSALVSLLRLIHNANTSVKCEVNWGIGSASIDLGNLSIALLEAIAELEPDVTTESVDLLGRILGLPLTETILDVIAALGVCPVLDAQFVDDLQSIDRLNDSASGDLLVVLVEVLKALGEGSNSRIPEMVDLLSIPHAIDASIPLEETLRDLGGSPLLETLAASLGAMLTPEEYINPADIPDGIDFIEFEDIWEMVGAAFAMREDGETPLSTTLPLLEGVVAQPGTWSGLYALGELLTDERSETQQSLSMLPTLLSLDPDLRVTRQVAGIFFAEETAEHFAVVLEIPELYSAVSTSSAESPGPMVFFADLQLSGTLNSLLGTIDRTIGLLGLTTD